MAGPATRSLRVVSKRDGFRRAGRDWTGSTTVKLSELTAEQVEQLTTEPMLVVDEVDTPADATA
jgi:hypothetical protein